MGLSAVGHGGRQRSLLDYFSAPARGTEAGWGMVGAQATRRERERARGRGVWSQECSIIRGKELTSLGRLLPVPPRGQVSKSRSRLAERGGLARVRLARSPEARRRVPCARPALRSRPYQWRRDAAAGRACCWPPLSGSRESL